MTRCGAPGGRGDPILVDLFSILSIGAELIGIVDPVSFVLFTLVLNLTRFFARSRDASVEGVCRVVAELNRRSFDFASRDKAARGSAQDDIVWVDGLI